MLKNGQTYFKNLAVLALQDFKSMFDYISTLYVKGDFDYFSGLGIFFDVKM